MSEGLDMDKQIRLATSPERRLRPGTGSVSWKIHREVVVLLGWGRAILLQFAHPLVTAGVLDHSGFQTARRGRLQRLHGTLSAMLETSFGTMDDITRVAHRINTLHDRVHGRLREAVGAFPAGTPYSARDPALLRWVHATLVESNLIAYERFVGPLTSAEKDRYCVEATGMELLLGMPRGYLPASVADIQTYLAGMLASGHVVVSEGARQLAKAVLDPPTPPAAREILFPIRLVTAGLLPPPIREAYALAWGRQHEATFHVLAALVRAALPCLPSFFRHWPAARAALRERESGSRAA